MEMLMTLYTLLEKHWDERKYDQKMWLKVWRTSLHRHVSVSFNSFHTSKNTCLMWFSMLLLTGRGTSQDRVADNRGISDSKGYLWYFRYFLKHSINLVNNLYKLFLDQSPFSFTYTLTLLIPTDGSEPHEEDEHIGTYVRGKSIFAVFWSVRSKRLLHSCTQSSFLCFRMLDSLTQTATTVTTEED